jgi:segregation and condensation protein A
MIDRLAGGSPTSFRQLTSHVAGDTMEVVVRFLAVLELFKQGAVELDQVGRFGDLVVEWVGTDADREVVLASVDVYDG